MNRVLTWVAVAVAGLVVSLQAHGTFAQVDPAPVPPVDSGSTPTPPLDVHLACHGIASFTETTGGSAVVFGSGGSASAFANQSYRGQTEDDVFFDVQGDGARIKLPAVLLPPIHTGDDHGWRPIYRFQMTDTEFTGKMEINFINKPSVSINRVTGHIDLRGFGRMGFSGNCKPYDASPASRLF